MDSPHEPIEEFIDHYKVVRKIGQGGMGEVFLVLDETCSRTVALKRIRSDIQIQEKHRKQFLQEAKLTSKLTHPYIIPIYSIVNKKNLLYYTMPYIEGRLLKELIAEACQLEQEGKRAPLSSSTEAFTEIFFHICEAVNYAHNQGMLHRDLKPSNIIIGPSGELRLLDWGLIEPISKQKPAKSSKKRRLSGTLTYFAPEMASGGTQNYQSEIYALGLIFYEMLTLRYPFHRSTVEDFTMHLQKEVLVDPAKVAPFRNISPALSQIACKCLLLEPEERYKNVSEILNDLEKAKNSQVNLLAAADTCLTNKEYDAALKEYRRVGTEFQNTERGRRARYLAAMTLFEHGKSLGNTKKGKEKIKESLKEFDTLHEISAAPFEYFGKTVVYHWLKDDLKELEAFEYAFTHFRHHPLIHTLYSHLLKRLEDSFKEKAPKLVDFTLLASRFIPKELFTPTLKNQISELRQTLKPLSFMQEGETEAWPEDQQSYALSIEIAFHLAKPKIIVEVINELLKIAPSPLNITQMALYTLIELGEINMAKEKLDELLQEYLDVQALAQLKWTQEAVNMYGQAKDLSFLKELPKRLSSQQMWPIVHFLNQALKRGDLARIHETLDQLSKHELTIEQKAQLDEYRTSAFLLSFNGRPPP